VFAESAVKCVPSGDIRDPEDPIRALTEAFTVTNRPEDSVLAIDVFNVMYPSQGRKNFSLGSWVQMKDTLHKAGFVGEPVKGKGAMMQNRWCLFGLRHRGVAT
jgi:hypothetical protein